MTYLLGDCKAVVPAISQLKDDFPPEVSDGWEAAVAVVDNAHTGSKARCETVVWSRLELFQCLLH